MSKSCSGTQTLTFWTLVAPSCIYDVTLYIDGSAITNTVQLNSGMTTAQIAVILNSNRTGNTTGTFTVAIVGTNLEITINNIVLTDTALGVYSITASGTGFPCGDFSLLLATLTCNIIPTPRGRKKGGVATFQSEFCHKRERDNSGNLIPCPDKVNILGMQIYTKYYEDDKKCCYRIGDLDLRESPFL